MFPPRIAQEASRVLPPETPHSFARRRLPLPLAALAIVAWLCSTGYAADVVEIEEHWELSVGEPDAASSSPQISMVMSPTGDLEGDYFVFTLNHRSDPEWIPGGMQVQRWYGDEIEESRVGPSEGALHHTGELIRWVQRTKLSEGSLIYEVDSGESQTWGSFGAAGHLRFAVSTQLAALNEYRPAISLEESGVSFAGNRVASLVLRKLRWRDAQGQVYELNAPIDVDADIDP